MKCHGCGGPVEMDLSSREKWKRCRACRNAYYRAYNDTHPESVQKRRAWREANADKVRGYGRKWERKARADGRKFVMDKRDGSLMNSAMRFELYDRDQGICWLCESPVLRDEFHLDHVIPVSKGGPTQAWNLKIAHPSCNRSKGNRPQPFDIAGVRVVADPLVDPMPLGAGVAVAEAIGALPAVMIDGRYLVVDCKSIGPTNERA